MTDRVRRSARTRKSNPKYTDSSWSKEALRQLRASSDSSSSGTEEAGAVSIDDGDDIEFDNAAASSPSLRQSAGAQIQHEDSYHSENGSSAVLSQSGNETEPDDAEEGDGLTSPRSKVKTASVQKPLSDQRAQGKEWAQSQGLRSRNMDVHFERSKRSLNQQYPLLFGPTEEDLRPVLQTRDIWGLKARDITLPSRASLRVQAELDEEQQQARPYAHGSSTSPTIPVTQVDSSEAILQQKRYMACTSSQHVVIGPWPGQQKLKLDPHQTVSVAESLIKTSTVGSAGKQPQHAAAEETTKLAHQKGWLLNAGSRVQCLEWAPFLGDQQFLTIAPTCTAEQRGSVPTTETDRPPAFVPSPSYPSSIQLWRVPTIAPESDPTDTNNSLETGLAYVLCTDWGDTQLIRYNRLKGVTTNVNGGKSADLAVLCSDGNVRIVPLAEPQSVETVYEHTDKPPFVAYSTKESVFTTFCFATTEDLAVGASNGSVSLFSLKPTQDSFSSSHEAQPYLTLQIHPTYVSGLAIATDLPQYLASQSAGGELVLTDLRTPHQDRVSCHKTRLPTRNLTYLPFTRAFLTTSDSAGNSEPYGTTISSLTCHSLRHFYFSNTIAKLPEASGVVTAMAASTAHPCVLIANSQGQVFATNYARKILPSSARSPNYIQQLFEYDWQPGDALGSAASHVEKKVRALEGDLYHHSDPRPGTSRLTRGFRPDRIELGTGTTKRPRPTEDAAATTQVIFEEEQAVTAMAWNLNNVVGREFGSWAAVAWGSGIVWMGDLGHDAR